MERVLGDVLRERAEDGLLPTSILDFGPKLGNHCKVLPVYAILRASILDFKPRLANRRSQKVKTGAIRAAHLQHAFHHALTMRLALDV